MPQIRCMLNLKELYINNILWNSSNRLCIHEERIIQRVSLWINGIG